MTTQSSVRPPCAATPAQKPPAQAVAKRGEAKVETRCPGRASTATSPALAPSKRISAIPPTPEEGRTERAVSEVSQRAAGTSLSAPKRRATALCEGDAVPSTGLP